MASGKSYWGNRLSKRTGLPFVDLDNVIETVDARPVPLIFEDSGETYFRELERKTLQNLDMRIPHIVATGGGTPCFFDNMAWMNKTGTTIYLETPVDVLLARLRLDVQIRPLLQGVSEHDLETFLVQHIEQREPWYSQAQVILPYTPDEESFLDTLVNCTLPNV